MKVDVRPKPGNVVMIRGPFKQPVWDSNRLRHTAYTPENGLGLVIGSHPVNTWFVCVLWADALTLGWCDDGALRVLC